MCANLGRPPTVVEPVELVGSALEVELDAGVLDGVVGTLLLVGCDVSWLAVVPLPELEHAATAARAITPSSRRRYMQPSCPDQLCATSPAGVRRVSAATATAASMSAAAIQNARWKP